MPSPPRSPRPRARVVRGGVQGFFRAFASLFQFHWNVKARHERPAAQVGIVSRRVFGVAMLESVMFLSSKSYVQCFRNFDGGALLKPENIFQVTCKIVGPDLNAVE